MSFKMAENLFKGLKYFSFGEGLQNISTGTLFLFSLRLHYQQVMYM